MKNLTMILVAVMLTSCITARQNAYKTLAITAATVDTALKAYADAKVAGKVSDATHAKVAVVKTRYEKAFVAAVAAAQANLESPTPADVVAIATELVNILNAATE